MNSEAPRPLEADVVVIGGALAGASTALLLRRARPDLRVVVIEKSTTFTRRVGEATVEVSGYFLGRVLGLTGHLNDSHLVKQGMRFWFSNPSVDNLGDCAEIGGRYLVRLPAYQVDRAVLDEEVLRRAAAAGAEVHRGTRVETVTLREGGVQTIEYSDESGSHSIDARWVVDASGPAAVVARRQGWYQVNQDHPTAAVWARWRGVKDLDGPELAAKHPEWASACYGIRSTATNHLMGDGWWAWVIPLRGGDVSVGMVYDRRRVSFSGEGRLGDRLKRFLSQHPAGAEWMERAEWVEGDVHARSNLAYSSRRYFGDGFALVGDAGAFLDPYYSPGMDWLSFTVSKAVKLILTERGGADVRQDTAMADQTFSRSYNRWFNALYRNKYDYMGEFDLVRIAFQLDLGLYYQGVVSQPFRRGAMALEEPVFSTPASVPIYHLMRFYNRRMSAMARLRRKRGQLGRLNARRRFLISGFQLERSSARGLIRPLCAWAWLEVIEGWRSWWTSESTADESVRDLPHLAPESETAYGR